MCGGGNISFGKISMGNLFLALTLKGTIKSCNTSDC